MKGFLKLFNFNRLIKSSQLKQGKKQQQSVTRLRDEH